MATGKAKSMKERWRSRQRPNQGPSYRRGTLQRIGFDNIGKHDVALKWHDKGLKALTVDVLESRKSKEKTIKRYSRL